MRSAVVQASKWALPLATFLAGVTALLICLLGGASLTVTGLVGGCFGFLSGVYALYKLSSIDHCSDRPSVILLGWKTISEMFVALWFICGPFWNLLACNSATCSFSDVDESQCKVPSALLEFFEMASEAWLLCITADLLISVSNPFSSAEKRILTYHGAVWSFAGVMALLIAFIPNASGFWYVDSVGNQGICWINTHVGRNTYQAYVFLYAWIVIVFVYSLYVIATCYQRLNMGFSKVFVKPILQFPFITVHVKLCILYWIVNMTLYAIGNQLNNAGNDSNKEVLLVVVFLLASKAYVNLVVVSVGMASVADSATKEDSGIDTNSLRKEILRFITSGIRVSATSSAKSSTITKPHVRWVLYYEFQRPATSVVGLTASEQAWLWFKLLFGTYNDIKEVTSQLLRSTTSRPVDSSDQGSAPSPVTTEGMQVDETMPSTLDCVDEMGQVTRLTFDEKQRKQETDVEAPDAALRRSLSDDIRASLQVDAEPLTPNDAKLWGSLKSWLQRRTESKAMRQTITNAQRSMVAEFLEYEPFHFRMIRHSSGVQDEFYTKAFNSTVKERIVDGGASGAFFFFSKGEYFVAKSCSPHEMKGLLSTVREYANYMTEHRDSFITRIYGAYCLKIYGTELFFFVMNNIFATNENTVINEKYDLKGSWVSRSMRPPRNGEIVSCIHCNQRFQYHRKARTRGSRRLSTVQDEISRFSLFNPLMGNNRHASRSVDESSQDVELLRSACPYTVSGLHEPNTVLKDNDLKYKFYLPKEVSNRLLNQLKHDARFLCSLGIMDYSLLVGVHNREFSVETVEALLAGGVPPMDSASEERTSLVSLDSMEEGLSHPETVSSPPPQLPSGLLSVQQDSTQSAQALNTAQLNNLFTFRVEGRELHARRIRGPAAFYMGIVDFQQRWDWNKKLERFFKIWFTNKDPDGLSCIEPVAYRDRFISRIEDLLYE